MASNYEAARTIVMGVRGIIARSGPGDGAQDELAS